MKNTTLLKLCLALQALSVLAYTIFAFNNEGPNLLKVFFNNVNALGWNGQFCLDFSAYLTLSGLWICWRKNFSLPSILLGITAAVVGIMIFAPYLLYLLIQEKGDLKRVLAGDRI